MGSRYYKGCSKVMQGDMQSGDWVISTKNFAGIHKGSVGVVIDHGKLGKWVWVLAGSLTEGYDPMGSVSNKAFKDAVLEGHNITGRLF